jgi:hypothetical protein
MRLAPVILTPFNYKRVGYHHGLLLLTQVKKL